MKKTLPILAETAKKASGLGLSLRTLPIFSFNFINLKLNYILSML